MSIIGLECLGFRVSIIGLEWNLVHFPNPFHKYYGAINRDTSSF